MVFGTILPILSDTYGLTDTMSGLLLSGHQTGNLIASFLAGVIPIYLGQKKSILFLSSFVIIGFLLIIMTGNPWFLLIAFLFTGISRGSISNFSNKTVNDLSNSSPIASNFLHGLFAVGALLSPFIVILTTRLFGSNGWRITSVFIISLVLIAQILILKMPLAEDKMENNTKDKNQIDYSYLKNRYFWITIIILFFYLATEATITGFIVKYFIDSEILTVTQSQILSSVLWLGILIGRLSIVFLGNYIKKDSLLLILSVITAIFYGLLLQASNYPSILLIIIGLGIFMGGIYPTTLTIAGESIKNHPTALGSILLISSLGSIIMPTISGRLANEYGMFVGISAILGAIFIMLSGVLFYNFSSRKSK